MENDENKTSSPSSPKETPKRRSSEPNIQEHRGDGDDSNKNDPISLRRSETGDNSTWGQLASWNPLTEAGSLIWNQFTEEAENAENGDDNPSDEGGGDNDDDDDDDASSTHDSQGSSSPRKPRSPLRSYGMAGAFASSSLSSSPTNTEEQLTDDKSAITESGVELKNNETSGKIDVMMAASGDTSPCNSTSESIQSSTSVEKKSAVKNTQATENKSRGFLSVITKVVPVVLIAGGVAVYFVTRSESKTLATSDLTSSPSTYPSASPSTTFSPSSSPTLPFLFDPPSLEDCDRVRSGDVVQEQDLLIERRFDVIVDVAMGNLVGLTETMDLLELEIQQRLLPKLVGCDEATNRKLRDHRMLRNINRYIVGNGKVQWTPASLEGNPDCSSRMCLSATFNMNLFLKTAEEQYFIVVNLVEDIFGDDLVDLLQLERPLFNSVVARSVMYKDPTMAPSSMPSLVPSDAPSQKPTELPSKLPTVSPTRSPTFRPTPGPTLPPTIAPTLTPSFIPTDSPSQKPTRLPSNAPTRTSSMTPTQKPSKLPTSLPSRTPSMAPTREPSVSPTPGPTLTPSVAPTPTPTTSPPTRAPSVQPSRTPTMRPSQMPTPSPTMVPSSSPTGEEDRKGYFRQLDRPIRVACAGDSLTRGTSGGNPSTHSYPSQLRNLLGEAFEVHNYGRNAATARRGLSLSYVDMTEFQNSLNMDPDIYLLMLGTNDSRYWGIQGHDFDDSLEWLINKVQSISPESPPRVVLAIPPWVKFDNLGIRSGILVNRIQPEIEAVARNENVQLVNMYDVTYNQGDFYTSDGVHLNQMGYETLATNWKMAIECNQNGICEVGENCETCPGDCYLNCPSRG